MDRGLWCTPTLLKITERVTEFRYCVQASEPVCTGESNEFFMDDLIYELKEFNIEQLENGCTNGTTDEDGNGVKECNHRK